MSEWEKVRFSDAVSFVADKTDVAFADIEHYISTENMLPDFGGVRIAAGLPPAGSVSIFREGDTLFSNIRTYFRKVWRARFEGHCSNDVLVLRSKNAAMLLPEYLCYCCQSDEFIELSVRTAKGAKMPRGDKQALAAYEFFLPPLPEQRAIAHILGTLDDKIELNRRQSETLQEMARALFKAWFVDFEPVRAKMSGRWQRGQTLPGLPAHLWDLFPDRLVETEHGEVPQGWRLSTIGQEVTVCGGSTPSTKNPDFWEGGNHCWVTPKDLSKAKFPVLLDTERKITDAGLAKISSGLLPVGTVLLSSRAPIGYLAIAAVPTAINQGFIAMRCEGALSSSFVLLWCMENMEAIIGRANGSTFQEISKSNFRPLPVVVPSAALLKAFSEIVDTFYRQLFENEKQSNTLAALRDTLLPQLISGKLRVADAEKFLQERGL